MWTIDKQIDFCYGHRVWVQKLEHEFCAEGDTHTKCRFLHGHQGKVHVFLESDELNPQAMVTDFKHLGWLKNFLDDTLDHKFMVDVNDPLFETLTHGYLSERIHGEGPGLNVDEFPYTFEYLDASFQKYMYVKNHTVPGTKYVAGMNFDTTKLDDDVTKEFYDGFFLVDFIPTSENLSRWLFDLTQAKMKELGIRVSRIDWWETPKSRSTYRGE